MGKRASVIKITQALLAVMALSVCGNTVGAADAIPAKLNKDKISAESASIEEREAYYDEYVDGPISQLAEEDIGRYYVKVQISYLGKDMYENDVLSFLRTDNELLGSIRNSEESLELLPGIYKVISREADKDLGEIELLEPGEEVSITVDYENKEIRTETENAEYWIIPMELGKEYETTDFEGNTVQISVDYRAGKSADKKMWIVRFDDFESELQMLRADDRVPYLVHSKNGNFVWLYNEIPSMLTASSIGIYGYRKAGWLGDSQQIAFLEEPTDPEHLVCCENGVGAGVFKVKLNCRIGENGRLEVIENPDGYRYAIEELNDPLTLLEPHIFVEVDENGNVINEKLPMETGTVFTHYRYNEEEQIEDLKTEDGRIVRIRWEVYFSEPDPYYAIDDISGTWIFDGAKTH